MALPASSTGVETNVTALELQDLRPETPAPDSPTPNSNPTSSPESGSSASSTIDSFETALSDTDRAFIRWLKRRMLRARLLSYYIRLKSFLSAKLPETWLGKLAVFLAFYTAVFLAYETIALKRPTLDISKAQGLAAEAATAAAEWTAYSTWKNNICPAELARNISSAACEEAMKEPTPPPSKPRYHEENSLSHKLARRLVPLFNASYALEKELDASDNHCSTDWNLDAPFTQPVCLSIDAPEVFHKRWISSGTKLDQSEFPLPSRASLRNLKRWTGNLPPMTYTFAVSLTYVIIVLLLTMAIVRKWGRQRSIYCFWMWFGGGSLWYLTVHFTTSMYNLTETMAKDQFLDNCLAQKISQVEVCEACVRVFQRSSTLSIETEIKLWSIWQGYLFAKVSEFSADDFIFVSLVIANASVLLYFGHKYLARVTRGRSRRDAPLSMVNGLKGPWDSKQYREEETTLGS